MSRRRIPARLTLREREIVGLIARGLSNKEIARRLGIEVTTVKNHVHNILDKLGVARRADAVATLWSSRHACLDGRTAVFSLMEGTPPPGAGS